MKLQARKTAASLARKDALTTARFPSVARRPGLRDGRRSLADGVTLRLRTAQRGCPVGIHANAAKVQMRGKGRAAQQGKQRTPSASL